MMIFRQSLPFAVSIVITLAAALVTFAAGQDSLVPIQDWTSADGKVIHAELTKFEAGTAQFRTKEGRRYSIPDEKFSLRDQATILIARISDQFDFSYSADINTEFFYSQQIPENRRKDKINAYLGFGPKRFNLGIFIPSYKVDLRKFDEIQVTASGMPPFTYPIDDNSLASSGADTTLWTRVRIDVRPGRNESILPVLKQGLDDQSLTFVAKGKGIEERFTLSDSERNGIREIAQIYTQTSKLVKAGFIKRELLSTQKPGEDAASSPESPGDDDVLKPFREQLSQNKYGTLNWIAADGGAATEVTGLGYLGTDVVIRTASDEVTRIPFSELDAPGRKQVYEQRIEEVYGKKPLVLDSGTIRYFPPDWDTTRMIYHRGFFYSLLDGDRPVLVLNTWTGRFNGKPLTEILVRGSDQERSFKIPCEPAESREREKGDQTYTTTFIYLNADETEKAKELINTESVELRLNAEEKLTSLSLKDDELATSREAIALYFWHQLLQ